MLYPTPLPLALASFALILVQLCGRLRPDFLNRTGSEVLDGRRSFPSGHSSSAYAICWYGAFYILWSLHWRYSQAWQVRVRLGVVVQLLQELAGAGHSNSAPCCCWLLGLDVQANQQALCEQRPSFYVFMCT
jgi:membrane-associated PAP2 superfamily phosphatase